VTNAQLIGPNERPDERLSDGVWEKRQTRLYRLSDLRCKPETVEDASKGQLRRFRMVAKLG
jgi:hypothetical protein